MRTVENKIFLVDDDVFHLELMEHILHNFGYTDVHKYENGVSCLDNIHHNPQIVFLDHNMDIYSGYEVLRKIKRQNPNIFVVMVSAQEEIKTAVDALKHGAFDYVQKSGNMIENVADVLKRIELVKEKLRERKPTFLKAVFGFL
ncbi:Response regulator receiver domain-containing protein [Flexibacter flexilis DSM 6793]|uniref:Response regulator receiver domain-containing protein n=1 Tax=Flexibacter flexilis DSM 6793 TaxID=927664 RepID=A0A1I1LBJ0_9BACT|nr:response regulator [Flexibacter flexilis]SFC66900.1 Response regulator receiver domain-containing protein [Flexibacter flexilis DSM 6793]